MVQEQTIRIITGSYEHNLLCVALNITAKGEVFSPVFHFTPHTQSIRCLASTKKYLISGSNDELIRLYDLQHRKELGTLMHHNGKVLCAEFFASKWLLTGAGDGNLCLWRVKDWELLAELKGHSGAVNDLAIHSSGRIALSVSEDRRLILWNLMTARKASVKKLPKAALKVAWIPETASSYVVGYEKLLAVFDSDKKGPAEIPLTSSLYHMAFYKEWLAVSTNDGSISFFSAKKWDATPEFVLRGHASRVKDFSFFENLMASVSSDGKIVVWDMDKRDQIAVYSCGDRLNCVLIVPDGVETHPPVKRANIYSDAESEAESEPEPETVKNLKKMKKRKSKKPKVVTIEE